MGRDELDEKMERSLAQLAAATAEIAPGDDLTAAIMARVARVQPETGGLAGIARATAEIAPGDDLTAAIMARVARVQPARAKRPQPSWLDGVVRSGPIAIGLALAAAAASFFVVSTSQRDLDVTMVSAVDTVEVDP